jgi:hypothetical protein
MLSMVAIPKVCFRDLVILVIWHQRRSSFTPYLFGRGRLGGVVDAGNENFSILQEFLSHGII